MSIDEKLVISSNGAVRNESRPASIVVIGAGAVGVEFADVYASYGTQVTLLEALPRVLPIEDEDASTLITRLFGRRGITIKTGVKVSAVKPGGPGAIVETDGGASRPSRCSWPSAARRVPTASGSRRPACRWSAAS